MLEAYPSPKPLTGYPHPQLPAVLPPLFGPETTIETMASCPLFLMSPRYPPALVDAGHYPPLAGSADLPTSRRPRPRPGRRYGYRCNSSSSSAPRDRPPRPRQQRQRSQRPGGRGDVADPVGFLAKLGVSDRAFAQFLRDRYVLQAMVSVQE